tara:strand:+ start:1276 stop:1467 length:192 start_codon:yes stop_codon:yes gene_type:complete
MNRKEWINYIREELDKDYVETEENSIFLDFVEGQPFFVFHGGYGYYLGDGVVLDYNGEYVCER